MPHEISPYQSPASTELVPISTVNEANAMAPHLPSTELVPMRTVYDAYNTVNRSNLAPHTSELSPEDANQINNTYAIELHVGAHGLIPEKGAHPGHDFKRPTEVEYAAATSVIDGMQPGDVLFIESSGFGRQKNIVFSDFDAFSEDERRIAIAHLGAERFAGLIEQDRKEKASLAAKLETARQNRDIDAWNYAAGLASVKGIQVVYADADRLKRRYFEELGRQDPRLYNEVSPAISASRERDARNIMKDWALAHPVPESATDASRKPKLVLLFGGDHREGLEKAFDEVSLRTTTFELDDSMPERYAVMARRLGGAAIGKPLLLGRGFPAKDKSAFGRLKDRRHRNQDPTEPTPPSSAPDSQKPGS